MKNLIILRAGQGKLHESWSLNLPKNYELIISFYDESAYIDDRYPDIECYLHQDGGKWDNIFRILTTKDLSQYEYFWFPDDDIEITQIDLIKFFKIGRDYNLNVFQPSLTHDSYFTFIEVVRSNLFKLRYTQFVEIMCPCLHRNTLSQVLYLFEKNRSGYGLDLVWCRLPNAKYNESAVIDEVSMKHTRPVGGLLKQKLIAEGSDIFKEMEYVKSCFSGYTEINRSSLGGVLKNGKHLSGLLTDYLTALTFLFSLKEFQEKDALKKIKKFIKNRFKNKSTFSRLINATDKSTSSQT